MSTRAALASAVASLGVLVLGWQVGTAGGQTVTAAPIAATSTATGQTSTTTSTTAAGTTTSTSSAPATTTTTAAQAAATSTGGLTDGTYTGATATNRYGSVKVTITVSGGKVTAVNATANANDNHSAEINTQAVPVLKSETLAAQSADLSTVSGATYTSDSYVTSLQSALDQAAA